MGAIEDLVSLSLLKYVLQVWGRRRTQTLGSIEGVLPTLLLKYLLKAYDNMKKRAWDA